MAQFLSPYTLECANELLQWAREYLMAENPNIRRPHGGQLVCPFVRASVDNNSFRMVFHEEVNGKVAQAIEEIMLSYIEPFKRMGPFGANDILKKALLVVFPYIDDRETHVLDIVHQNIKNAFVDNALMVGQFHKNCDVRGAYNDGFRVSVSPLPLMAIRHMAIHDILFVGENERWFRAYNVQYGHRFNDPETIEDYDKHLLSYYFRAKARFLR